LTASDQIDDLERTVFSNDVGPEVRDAVERLVARSHGRPNRTPRAEVVNNPAAKVGRSGTFSLEMSPDPTAPHDESMSSSTLRNGGELNVPSWVVVAVKAAITTSWSTTSPASNTATTNSQPIPQAYKDLISLGPSLSSRSTTFLHYLIVASFELLLAAEEGGVEDEEDRGEESEEDFLVGAHRKGVKECVWALDGVWRVISWWRGVGGAADWSYPVS
jgi:hypothetical protein